ncbi:MAG TPA: IS21-like element helper ATPase IstB [Kofleriaceae bacterium]|nr:IS21-like element helper ATPase IstB [Kofleriaceae bacterium]
MMAVTTTEPPASLALMLRALKLPTVARHAEEVARLAEREGWTFERYVHHLVELEIHERRRRRLERYLKDSDLPRDKTLATLDRARLPIKIVKQLATLCHGGFVERGDNLLAFGLPGRGKTHLVCAIGYELIQRGYRVLFTATYALVQRLLAAKRDLRLEKELAILDGYDVVVCDDLGYVQQNRDEMEVLFTFLAERYERRSVIITSNLVFSEWDRIFKDPMTTAAAIDRIVHHCVILEMTGPSIRVDQAKAERATQGGTAPTTTELPTTANPTTPGAATTTIPTATTASPTTPGAATTTTPTAMTTSPTTPGAATTTTPTAMTTSPTTQRTPTTTIQKATTTTKKTKNRDHSTSEVDGEM